MLINTWAEIVTTSLQTLWSGFMVFLPSLLGAIVVFIVGWAIAVLLGRLTSQIVRTLRVDQVLEKMGLKKNFEKAGLKLDAGVFIGELVRWFFIIVFLMAATDILDLPQVTDFLKQVILYIPHLIVAVLILLVAILIANFLQRLVKASVEAAGLGSANILALITKWGVLVFAILAALLQLGIVPALIQTVFTGLMAAFVVAFGLAFGLGGKEFASELLEKFKRDVLK